ncbi:hypothetical protein G4X40_03540 [Rhodococcus sp. D2-41]|uniref:Uncharacterized protein n=1 Tax=Speluncibacter jeojiensis TaxID=2710754 RepID=A0A9X4M161_9ACTN|nr:hypothetical protein [Rhodococcus sp. D2-41]MDG3009215.1 hypothetical protein [Rhodococcus sp. D2-41]MDG3016110.1 hypothetical protein [Corynebacteriales bacterium D3-21]
MVAALKEALLGDSRLKVVVADVQGLIDAEVADKKGASGLAVKGGYAAVKKVGPSIVPDAIEGLLPGFVGKLEPYWDDFRSTGGSSFAEYLTARGDEVADALLGVTDERIEGTSKTAVKKVYSSMRSSAKKNVVEALPRLGALVEQHASA